MNNIIKLSLMFVLTFSAVGMTTTQSIINKTLSFEGSEIYQTSKYGIESSTLYKYNKRHGTNYKLGKLTKYQAYQIAEELYYDKKLNQLDSRVAYALFDYSFNSNSDKMYKRIHKAFGLKAQTILSDSLVNKLNSLSVDKALEVIMYERYTYMKKLPNFAKHKKGWLNRLALVKKGYGKSKK